MANEQSKRTSLETQQFLDANKTVSFGRYSLGPVIGEGTFGKVRLGTHALTGHKVAVKILSKRKIRSLRMDEKVKREIRIMKLFDHPHITKLYEVIDGWGEIYMILEYVPRGELFDLITSKGPFGEADVRHYFQQIISAVDYCHRNLIVHRDLKPENILLDANLNVKVADFGLSNLMADGNFLLTSCGSPNYAPPEVISGLPYVGPAVDVWSCGVILFAMIYGRLPFDDSNIQVLFSKIKSGRFTFPSDVSVCGELKALISGMLRVDPLQRISMEDVKCSPWFRVKIPKYLEILLVDFRSLTLVDEDIIDEVEALFSHAASREEIKRTLRRRDANEITVAYHLIKDQRSKRFADPTHDSSPHSPQAQTPRGDRSDVENVEFGIPVPTFALETKTVDDDANSNNAAVFALSLDLDTAVSSRIMASRHVDSDDQSSTTDLMDIVAIEQQGELDVPLSKLSLSINAESDQNADEVDAFLPMEDVEEMLASDLKKMKDRLLNKVKEKKKWFAGWRSRLSPSDLIAEICRVLKAHNLQWNFDAYSWQFKCCSINSPYLHDQDESDSEYEQDYVNGDRSSEGLCFEIRIFTVCSNLYAVDFQRTFGSPMKFLELSHALLTDLKL
ncbi:hypothetical protein RCL1_005902 [Eukaryota sp. TZLM3-RCL]